MSDNKILELNKVHAVSQSIIQRTKHAYAAYVCFPNDGNRHEIIDGDHFMNPAPTPRHQTVSRLIQYQLMTQIEMTGRGFVFNAPTDVELAVHDIVQPDLIVVMSNRKSIIGSKKLKGIPNLLIEILSESNPDHDKVLKMEAYERVDVPEYWIVDPEERTVHQFLLVSQKYILKGVHSNRVSPLTISDVVIDLEGIWG